MTTNTTQLWDRHEYLHQKAREEIRMAYANVAGSVMSSLAASEMRMAIIDPDPKRSADRFARGLTLSISAGLISSGVIPIERAAELICD